MLILNNTVNRRISHKTEDLYDRSIEIIEEKAFGFQFNRATGTMIDAHSIGFARFLDGASLLKDLFSSFVIALYRENEFENFDNV